ncbi:MAG: Uma2 family endonuclease [Bacteroidia bacterium]
MNTLLKQLLDAPDLALLMRDAQAELIREKRKREKFAADLDEDMKAEFINGEVVVHSPVRRNHYVVSNLLVRLLSTHVDKNRIGTVAVEKALIRLTRNDYEPDICFWGLDKSELFDGETMFHPAPDFVVEILSPSTAAYDRGIKLRDYAAHDISEYWIIDPDAEKVEQYLNTGEREYQLQGSFGVGDEIESKAVPAFLLPVKAIFDEQANMETLARIME